MNDAELAELAIDATDHMIRSRFARTEVEYGDVLGEVYLTFDRKRRKIEKHPNPKAYCRTLAKYEVIDHRNTEKKVSQAERRRAKHEKECVDRNRSHIQGMATDPHNTIAQVDHQDELELLLRSLGVDMRDLLIGRYVLRLGPSEMPKKHRGTTWASATINEALKKVRFHLSCSDMFAHYIDADPEMRDRWKPRKSAPVATYEGTLTYQRALDAAFTRWRARNKK